MIKFDWLEGGEVWKSSPVSSVGVVWDELFPGVAGESGEIDTEEGVETGDTRGDVRLSLGS